VALYTVVWERNAIIEWQNLGPDRALAVANNVTALIRRPHPHRTVIERGPDDLLFLHVGDVDVIYEIIGQTVRILGIEQRT
jgi:mRNA-degrading endonuclease RelE of RelBE toxin-antitoxin system